MMRKNWKCCRHINILLSKMKEQLSLLIFLSLPNDEPRTLKRTHHTEASTYNQIFFIEFLPLIVFLTPTTMSIPAKLLSTALLLLSSAFHTAVALSTSTFPTTTGFSGASDAADGAAVLTQCAAFPAFNEKCAGLGDLSPEAKQTASVAGAAAFIKIGKKTEELTKTDCLAIADAVLAVLPHETPIGTDDPNDAAAAAVLKQCVKFPAFTEKYAGLGDLSPEEQQTATAAGTAVFMKIGKKPEELTEPDCLTIVDAVLPPKTPTPTGTDVPADVGKVMEHCAKKFPSVLNKLGPNYTPDDGQAAIAAAEAAFKKIGKKPTQLTETDCLAIVDAVLGSKSNGDCGCRCWVVVVVVLAVLLAAGALVLFLVFYLKKDREEEGSSDSSVY